MKSNLRLILIGIFLVLLGCGLFISGFRLSGRTLILVGVVAELFSLFRFIFKRKHV